MTLGIGTWSTVACPKGQIYQFSCFSLRLTAAINIENPLLKLQDLKYSRFFFLMWYLAFCCHDKTPRKPKEKDLVLVYGFGDSRAQSLGSLYPRSKVRYNLVAGGRTAKLLFTAGRQVGEGGPFTAMLWLPVPFPRLLLHSGLSLSVNGLTNNDLRTCLIQ